MNIRNVDKLEKAKLEDVLIELLYTKYRDLVFHGGTAIWRCYSGNRFSRDIDFYIDISKTERKSYYREIADFLKESGFSIKEKGYNNVTDTMHFLVESNSKMKIGINFKYKKGIPAEYTKVDDSKVIVISLTPKELLNEKIETYNDKLHSVRGPEVQDLYDIYYLTSLIKERDTDTVKKLSQLIKNIEKNPPSNMRSLDELILAGLPPTFELMIEKLKGWLNGNK
jgi:predicted nucleotidyltransferase component of viral defense system